MKTSDLKDEPETGEPVTPVTTELLGDVEPPDLDQPAWKIDIHITATGYNETFCWKDPLLVSTSSVWLHGPKGTVTPSDHRTFRAQDPGFEYGARTADGAEEDKEFCSKEHGNEAHELHLSGDALFSARRNEGGIKLRELLRKKERALPTPTPPNCSRKAPFPDSVISPPESPRLSSLRGAAHKAIKTRRKSSGSRKTQGHSLFTARVYLPLADLPSLPFALPFLHPPPSRVSPELTK